MPYFKRLFPVIAAGIGLSVSLAVAPVADAAPECVQIGPNTTQCATKGSTAITTSPPYNPWNNYGPLFWGGWGGGWGGGLVIGIG